MNNTGWIKLYRNVMESAIWKNANYLRVFLWCLMKANHEENKFPFNGEDIIIKRGQFITGRKEALRELKPLTLQSWRSATSYLKSTHRINTQTTNRFTIITVCNYDIYQPPKNESNQSNQHPSNQQVTNKQTSSNQPVTTNKNYNNIENKEDKNILLSDLSESDGRYEKIAYSFWVLFKDKLAQYNINSTDLSKVKAKNWVAQARLMIEADKRTNDELEEVWQFLKDEIPKTNGFAWSKNIRSMGSLRKQFEKVLIESRIQQKIQNNGTYRRNNNRASDGSTIEDLIRDQSVKLGIVR